MTRAIPTQANTLATSSSVPFCIRVSSVIAAPASTANAKVRALSCEVAYSLPLRTAEACSSGRPVTISHAATQPPASAAGGGGGPRGGAARGARRPQPRGGPRHHGGHRHEEALGEELAVPE